MDDKTLQALKAKVEEAEGLQKKIKTLEEVIASCEATVGFIAITMNYKNQNEIRLADRFGAKDLHDHFKTAIMEAAAKLKDKLEADYIKLK